VKQIDGSYLTPFGHPKAKHPHKATIHQPWSVYLIQQLNFCCQGCKAASLYDRNGENVINHQTSACEVLQSHSSAMKRFLSSG
jgi:hypothetical protein